MDGAWDRGEPGRTTPFKTSRGAPEGTKSPSGVALFAYAATTRCRENGNGYPAGGLCACAGQSPRWVRIFPVCRGRHRQVDDLGLLDDGALRDGVNEP